MSRSICLFKFISMIILLGKDLLMSVEGFTRVHFSIFEVLRSIRFLSQRAK